MLLGSLGQVGVVGQAVEQGGDLWPGVHLLLQGTAHRERSEETLEENHNGLNAHTSLTRSNETQRASGYSADILFVVIYIIVLLIESWPHFRPGNAVLAFLSPFGCRPTTQQEEK